MMVCLLPNLGLILCVWHRHTFPALQCNNLRETLYLTQLCSPVERAKQAPSLEGVLIWTVQCRHAFFCVSHTSYLLGRKEREGKIPKEMPSLQFSGFVFCWMSWMAGLAISSFSILRVIQLWSRLPTQGVGSPFLETFKINGTVLSNLFLEQIGDTESQSYRMA